MSDLLVERVGQTCFLTLNRPEVRNALTRGLLHDLTGNIVEASRDQAIRCIVIAGSEGAFCAGADLRKNVMEDPELLDRAEQYVDEYHGLIRAVVASPKPMVAEMDGPAVGFGADLALACDFRVASTRAYIEEKFVKIGLMPDGGGTSWLPRLVGTARAMKMIMLGERMSAKELHELGVFTELVGPSNLRETTLLLTSKLEKGPPLAMEAIRTAVYGSLGQIDEALRRERKGQLRLLRSADLIEGVSAWMQKREPSFQGR